MFNICAVPILQSVIEGYNGTIFAYGQTGTGKTFTMEGEYNNEALMGMTPRTFRYIFEEIEKSEQTQYLVRASMIELYNEQINDLLEKDKDNLKLRNGPEGFYVEALSTHIVNDKKDLMRLLEIGKNNRKTASTQMNEVLKF